LKALEITIVVLYAVAIIVIGLFFRKKAQASTSGFWSAGASVPIFVNAFCLFATVMSGGGMMGNIGLAASMGISYILCANLGSGSGLGMGAILVAKPLRRSGSKTISEFIQMRYANVALGFLVPIVVMIAYVLYLVAQMKASGTVGQYLLGVSFNQGLLITWAIFTVYVMTGGMLAVTWTDFIQGLLMMAVTITAAIAALIFYGGFGDLIDSATALYPNMGQLHLPLLSYAGFFFVWVFIGLCSPHILMRVSSAKSPFAAAVSMQGGMLIITVFSILTSIVLGSASRVAVGTQAIENNDAAFLYLIDVIFSPLLKGLTAAAIYAAIMSTAAGLLLAAAAALANDIIPRIKKDLTEKQKTLLASISVLVVSCIVLAFSFNPPAFITILYSQAMNFLVCCLMIPMLAGLWWKRATSLGALLSLLGGGITYAILFFGLDMPTFSEMFIALPVGLLMMVVGSLASPPPSDEMIAKVASWHRDEKEA
jgi:sodium/pantothenate symporter